MTKSVFKVDRNIPFERVVAFLKAPIHLYDVVNGFALF